MNRKDINGLHLWQFESLEREPGIKHFVSDRSSSPLTDSFSLSLSSSPHREEILRNRKHVADALAIPANQLFFPSQVHKTRIVTVTSTTSVADLQETDALVTNERGLCLAVMSADCVPILLYDKKNQAIGAVHSGWKGTVARILEKTLRVMTDTYGTQGKDVIAGIGPSVSQDSYEVGDEVVQEVHQAFGQSSGLLIPQRDNKAKLDLWKANQLQLLEFGVDSSSIEISDLCTIKNNQHFFSARKGDAGRFAAGIMLTVGC